MTTRHAILALALFLVPTSGFAQVPQRIAPYVIDLRGFNTGLGQDPTTARDLGLQATDLPKRGLGGVVGVHFYPLRRERFALGLGGEYLLARGRLTPEADTTTTPPTLPATPIVEQRLISLSPQLSLNFGGREGWSYLTAGMGKVSFETFAGTIAPAVKPEKKNTINMGGGARWFASAHVAFMFDVRFYLTRPADLTATHPGRARSRLRILSAGIALR